MALLIILGIIALVVIYVIVQYNGLVRVRNRIENGWAQIEVQLPILETLPATEPVITPAWCLILV